MLVLLIPELVVGDAMAGRVAAEAGVMPGDERVGAAAALAELLHMVAVDGPAHGIHIVAATCQADRLAPDVIAHFTTRLVLQLPDAMQSIRLLGRPDAADLTGGGQLLFVLEGREPVRLYGFRVVHERMVELGRLLNDATGHGGSGSSAGWPLTGSGLEPRGAPTDGGPGTPSPQAPAPSSGVPEEMPGVVAAPERGRGADLVRDGPLVAEGGAAPDADAAADAAEVPAGTREGAIAAAAGEMRAGGDASAPGGTRDGGDVGAPGGTREEASAPHVEVRCFGGFEVLSAERPLSAAGQSGPRHRSWEVLAYLAAQPAEVVSTEKLLAAVWPESGQEKASSAFSAALSRLRGVLAHQVPGLAGPLVTRDRVGRTCRLEGVVMISDVHRFVALCREARRQPPAEAAIAYERARGLYVGELLKDQPFRWLHERDNDGLTLPERYRETYRQITDELAGMYVRRGQPALAAPLYRELLRAEPTLEDVARRLYNCYGQLADRVSLVREHHRLQQALRDAYGDPDGGDDPAMTAPEPETVAIFEAVLARLDADVADVAGVTDVADVAGVTDVGGPVLHKVDGPRGGGAPEDEEGCAA